MFKLLKNEFFKLIHKKSTLVFIVIIFLYIILVHVIYSYQANTDYDSKDAWYTQNLNDELSKLDKNSESYYKDFATISAQIDTFEQADKFNETWQQNIIHSDYHILANSYYENMYVIQNEAEALKIENEMKHLINLLNNNNWQYFVKKKITEQEKNLIDLKNTYLNSSSTEQKELAISIKTEEYLLKLNKYRLEKNVSYDENYLNEAITQLELQINHYYLMENNNEKDKQYYQDIKGEILKYEYILENEVDISSQNNLRASIMAIFTEYIFFIVLFVIMITGGILSEEFNKGTIKSLLITPYSRTKILLSKFITSLLSLPIITLITLIFVLLIGGITFGFSSLNIPVVEYSYSLDKLVEMNLFTHFLLMFAVNAPMIILLITLAFSLSVIIPNTAFAIALSFAGYIAGNIINALALTFNAEFLKYFVTLNWDFNQYLFGRTPMFEFITLPFSIIICIIYFLIMIIFCIILFKHKNVKNI